MTARYPDLGRRGVITRRGALALGAGALANKSENGL